MTDTKEKFYKNRADEIFNKLRSCFTPEQLAEFAKDDEDEFDEDLEIKE